jgi:16S rRNA (cytosine967-C5)-methyltransferase
VSRPDARRVAYKALAAVLDERRPLDDWFDDDKDLAALEPRDRALARAIVAETLRRLGQIDALIRGCLARRLPKKALPARQILRMGVAQLLFMELAPHAAISTSVDLAKQEIQPFARLVNAVLRRLQREGQAMMADQDAARLNAPEWLWESWCETYGEETAHGIAAAHLDRAPLDLSVKGDAEPWAKELGAELLPTGSLRLKAEGDVTQLAGFGEGAWWVQDAAAALPARLLGEVKDRTVIDLCAAPGGKTAQLAASGARVTAVDLSDRRLARLETNLARLGLSATLVGADAASWRPDKPADAVLLDAPCSGTGTIRRHPDIAWTKRPEDVARLAGLQARLLENALAMVKPGGLVVYAVCSLQREEGAGRTAALLASRRDVEVVPVTADEVGGAAQFVDAAGALRTLPCHWPDRGGVDGFYAVRLRRIP